MRWSGVIALEGVETMNGDGRFIKPDALEWELPRLLVQYPDPSDGMDWSQAEVIGSVDSIERDGKYIRASGTLDKKPQHRGLEMGLYQWVGDYDDGTLVTTSAHVHYVAVGERPVWGDCWIEIQE